MLPSNRHVQALHRHGLRNIKRPRVLLVNLGPSRYSRVPRSRLQARRINRFCTKDLSAPTDMLVLVEL